MGGGRWGRTPRNAAAPANPLTKIALKPECYIPPLEYTGAGDYGIIHSTNIIDEIEISIGAWRDHDFLRALHQRIATGG